MKGVICYSIAEYQLQNKFQDKILKIYGKNANLCTFLISNLDRNVSSI